MHSFMDIHEEDIAIVLDMDQFVLSHVEQNMVGRTLFGKI